MEVLHALEHALLDTILVFPILYLAYLLVSYFSHSQNNKYTKFLHHSKKAGPVVGAFLGCIPQCGFSSVMSQFYSQKVITLGTLMSVFIATSDEAIPIMISQPQFIPSLLALIGIKFVFAIIIGYSLDGVIYLINKRKKAVPVEPITEEVHPHVHNHHCCAKNIFLDALKHTAVVFAYVFVITFVLNIIEETVGLDALSVLFTDNVFIQVLIASLIGLIPNCAASVFIVELYMSGVLHFGALVAGLCAGAGVGLIVLFTLNYKKIKENVLITVLLYIFAVLCGFATSFISL